MSVNKYNAIVQTTAKDEEHIINEWIVHHILLGFEHIYIYDDYSKIPITETIKKLPSWILGKVTVYRLEKKDYEFNNEIFLDSKYYNKEIYKKECDFKQKYFLNYFLIDHKYISKWCFFCDVDEFIYIKEDTNINDFLNKYENYDKLFIPWLTYGSSFHIDQPKGLVIENFIYHDKEYHTQGKSIIKLSEISYIHDVHEICFSNKCIKYDSKIKLFDLPIHINHYQINSIKTFLKRKIRPHIGEIKCDMRPANHMYIFLTLFNNIKTNIMNKYIGPINLILQNNNINNNINNNKNNIDYINAFYCNNRYIYKCENYELLTEMLQSDNLRYCKRNELNHLYDNIPGDFDVKMYISFNPDLESFNDDAATVNHYSIHGWKEGRKFKDKHFCKEFFANKYNFDFNDINLYSYYINDIRQLKNNYFSNYIDNINFTKNNHINYIFLVNHDSTLFGANHYTYLLYNYLNKKYANTNIKILLCEIEYNYNLYDKYNISKENVLEYQDDPTLLYLLYNKIKPKVVYLNSCNWAIVKLYKYIPESIRILHSHEIFDHYLLAKQNIPDFVVSDIIAQQYFKYYKKIPQIQPPFLTDIDNILLLANENIENICNRFGNLDSSKITIGMCGQIRERKNYELFISISQNYLDYNFVWVGDNSDIFDDYKNIYHIKSTNNPYKYYKKIIDYFILFSKQDPCPYVILENILLESNIITFNKNIFYHHNNLLKDIYFSYDGEINFDNCKYMINNYVSGKKNNTTNNGYEYINKYFSGPNIVEKKIEEMILNN